MSYPPEGVVCDDPALGRMRGRYDSICRELAHLKTDADRLRKEISDRERTVGRIAEDARAASVELELVRAWLRTADPEFPAPK